MQNLALYLLTSLIWGSTWLAIKFQLGTVDPEFSIVYRFALAAVLLLVFCALRKLPMRFSPRQHFFIALEGISLFSINYVLVYLAEQYLTSGLVAIVFSLIVILNVLFGGLLLRDPVRPRVVVGGVLGIAGLAMMFQGDLSRLDLSGGRSLGLLMAFAGTLSASLGNIVSARNQRNGLPVVQTNAIGMAYGTLFTLIVALLRGATPTFELSLGYVSSLLYLALFGSVVAFGAYLTLLGRVGADRAGYVTVLLPVIALILSTAFEGLSWQISAAFGAALVMIGNTIALTRRSAVRPVVGEPAGPQA